MPARLPTLSDFPSDLTLTVTPPPANAPRPTNILIFLHGLGDTAQSLENLAIGMALPETVCISIQAPSPMPFDLGGFNWGDDVIFDSSTGQVDADTGFKKAREIVGDVVSALKEKCGFMAKDLLIFGFQQGGMVALSLVLGMGLEEVNGVIVVGAKVPQESSTPAKKNRSPVLVLGGSSGSAVTETSVARVRECFEFVERKKWKKTGDGAMRSREEMLPIMQFFGRRLKSRHGVPEGAVELS